MTITPIVGLEVHVELKTLSKMFCGCSASHFHIKPNTHTCPVCLGLPGALPVPNKTACLWCIKIGLALNCSINLETFFERKNYFYPDLPKGYQISQLQKPFAINGFIKLNGQKIRINRAHMEEDTAKSQHQLVDGQDATLLDFNRSGVPLVEIVSEPDITSAIQAKLYLQKIQQIIRYLGVSDADIDKGSMRCEPTINLKIEKNGKTYYTPLVEVKNVASLTGVELAIDYEIKRQTEEFAKTQEVKSALNKTTRGWDANKAKTFLQRQKEGSADYRYFPEPDIPPIIFSQTEIDDIKASLPELPDQKLTRYKGLGLSDYDATLLTDDYLFSLVFDKVIKNNPEKAKGVANLLLGPIKQYLNQIQENIDINKIDPGSYLATLSAVDSGQISSTVAKQITVESYQTGQDPLKIAQSRGLMQVSDTGKLEVIVDTVIKDNPDVVKNYQKNPNVIGFLIGAVMKASAGSANPQIVREILELKLK